jgi:Ca-activated chloride channel homolog
MTGWTRITSAGVFAAATSAALLAQQPQGPTFKAGTQVVSLFVTVNDAQKRLVPDLTQEDFEIFDNEKPQPVTYFDNSILPITVVVMLDTSGSMTMSIDLLKRASEQFLMRLLPEDKAKVGAFNDKVQISARFTNDRDQLISEVKDLDYGNGTRLWDAIGLSLDELKGVEGRRVILVFTDGDDMGSRSYGLGRVIERARAEEVMVYAIGLEGQVLNQRTRPDGGLRKIADETGGGYFELKKTSDLAPTFTRVAAELHSQYVIGFAPTLFDNRVHKLMVKMKPAGLTARARRSYVATAPTSSQ